MGVVVWVSLRWVICVFIVVSCIFVSMGLRFICGCIWVISCLSVKCVCGFLVILVILISIFGCMLRVICFIVVSFVVRCWCDVGIWSVMLSFVILVRICWLRWVMVWEWGLIIFWSLESLRVIMIVMWMFVLWMIRVILRLGMVVSMICNEFF